MRIHTSHTPTRTCTHTNDIYTHPNLAGFAFTPTHASTTHEHTCARRHTCTHHYAHGIFTHLELCGLASDSLLRTRAHHRVDNRSALRRRLCRLGLACRLCVHVSHALRYFIVSFSITITLRRGDVQLEGRADEVFAAEGDGHLIHALH